MFILSIPAAGVSVEEKPFSSFQGIARNLYDFAVENS
jgi:hypothetical protein